MTGFPDLTRDPADVVDYAMDWSSRLPPAQQIAAIAVKVNGDVTVVDRTASYPAAALTLRVSGGSAPGYSGDPQVASLSVVTVVATLQDGEVLSRSFNVISRPL